MPFGSAEGMVCHLEEMLVEYDQVQGWNQDGSTINAANEPKTAADHRLRNGDEVVIFTNMEGG